MGRPRSWLPLAGWTAFVFAVTYVVALAFVAPAQRAARATFAPPPKSADVSVEPTDAEIEMMKQGRFDCLRTLPGQMELRRAFTECGIHW